MTTRTEADITINGIPLNYSQSMTVRCALESFASELSHTGLGDDELGIAITAGYLRNIREIRVPLYSKSE